MRTDDRSRRRYRNLWGAKVLRNGYVIYWWAEILAILIFYVVYSTIRNADSSHAAQAFSHAKQLMGWQQSLGINHEQTLNDWALHFKPLVITANYFYGSLHFIVTIGVAVYLFRKWPDDYPRWRNTLGVATLIALIGFRFWPLMPPRLLDAPMYMHFHPGVHYGFVDTLENDPAFWTFNSGAMKSISNQFAAMPSVHCAWALWCACALVPRLRRTWAKWLAAAYPALTVSVIVVTANHYFLDAVGGFVILGIGYVAARLFTRAGRGPAVEPGPVNTS
jgi:PAP2 superfamily